MISVRFVESCADIAAPLWNACFPSPREGLWWYRALEGSLGDQFRFLYGLIEDDGRAVGIAPCFVFDYPLELVVPPRVMAVFRVLGKLFPGLIRQRVLFVGSPCAEEGWVGLVDGVDRHAALLAVHDAATAEARRRGGAMVAWKDFPQAEKANMAWLGRQRGLFCLPSYPNAVVRLPGAGKEDYLASLKGSRRHQLKKKLRISREHLRTVVEVVQTPPPAVMDEIFGLFWNTFERADKKLERLNRRCFDLLAEEPCVHFILLREEQSGDAVAMMMCFAAGDLVINKFVGFDYGRPKEWMLYHRLWDAAVDWSLARGAAAIQSGQTCYKLKFEQGHTLSPLFNFGCHANPVVHNLFSRVAEIVSWESLDEDLAAHLKAHPEEAAAGRP